MNIAASAAHMPDVYDFARFLDVLDLFVFLGIGNKSDQNLRNPNFWYPPKSRYSRVGQAECAVPLER